MPMPSARGNTRGVRPQDFGSVLICALALASCQPAEKAAQSSAPLPRLALVTSMATDSFGADLTSRFAVASSGAIALSTRLGDTATVAVLSPRGQLERALGHPGGGPDEVRGIAFLQFDDSSRILATDPGNAKLLLFDLSHATTHPIGVAYFAQPMRLMEDSLLLLGLSAQGLPAVQLLKIGADSLLTLIGASDSAFRKGIIEPWISAKTPMERQLPGASASAEEIVLGDAKTYRLWAYDLAGNFLGQFGRNLPPVHLSPRRVDEQIASLRRSPIKLDEGRLSRARENLQHQDQPFFRHNDGLGFDGRGRLWVVGIEGDSAYADVFDSNAFLGRIAIGCSDFAGSWSVSGARIAFLCAGEGSAASVVRVFRIEGS